jgi:hypothetical protein
MFLPSNFIFPIQSIDQGVIGMFKELLSLKNVHPAGKGHN